MTDYRQLMLNLIKSEICGTAPENLDVSDYSDETVKKIYALSKRHDLAHLIADALFRNGITVCDEVGSKLNDELFKAHYRYEQQHYEFGQICRTLEEAQVRYVPLKGAVIRGYYPEPWMRTSCDIDILIDEENIEKAENALIEKAGYRVGEPGQHDVALFSPGGVHLELHFNITENRVNIDSVLVRAWDYARRVSDGGYRYAFSDEFNMFHILAHMSYHFISGGCGARSLVDLWLLNRDGKYDRETLNLLLRESGIELFNEKIEKVTHVWFDNEKPDRLTEQIQSYIFYGGVYGSFANKTTVSQIQKGNKLAYIASRIWLPYSEMRFAYPILKKHKALLPFYEVRRWLERLFRGRIKNGMKEINLNITDEQKNNTSEMLDCMGLTDFK